jgi:hypothetical protein
MLIRVDNFTCLWIPVDKKWINTLLCPQEVKNYEDIA